MVKNGTEDLQRQPWEKASKTRSSHGVVVEAEQLVSMFFLVFVLCALLHISCIPVASK